MEAAVYLRVSTQEQRNGFSLEGQYEDCRAYCERMGYRVVRKFSDVESGRVLERPAFQRMIGMADASLFQVVVVWRRDRFGRDVLHNTVVERALKKAGVRVEAVTTGRQADTEESELFSTLLDAVSQYEARKIAARCQMGRRQGARQGFWTAGKRPYGYERDPRTRRLVPLPGEAEKVSYAFSAVAEGDALQAVARALGVKHNTVVGWMRNPVYRGTVAYDGVTCPDAHPALVDAETWERAHAALDARCRHYRRRPSRHLSEDDAGNVLAGEGRRERQDDP